MLRCLMFITTRFFAFAVCLGAPLFFCSACVRCNAIGCNGGLAIHVRTADESGIPDGDYAIALNVERADL